MASTYLSRHHWAGSAALAASTACTGEASVPVLERAGEKVESLPAVAPASPSSECSGDTPGASTWHAPLPDLSAFAVLVQQSSESVIAQLFKSMACLHAEWCCPSIERRKTDLIPLPSSAVGGPSYSRAGCIPVTALTPDLKGRG